MQLRFPTGTLELDRPRVMGVLNVTPDSFSDGGRYVGLDAGIDRGLQMLEEGADIIDVGGESTRPGAQPVAAEDEIARVVPVIAALRQRTDAPISVDTSKPEVMRAAAEAGASWLNDVRGLREPAALQTAAELGLPVCVMHMQGQPRTMQANPTYNDVVAEVTAFLQQRAEDCVNAGIKAENVVLDPGFGFGKTLEHNVTLMHRLDALVELGHPVLIGVSRKSMIGALLGDDSRDRTTGSVTLALFAARKGAHILRVHDVRQTVEALRVEAAVAKV